VPRDLFRAAFFSAAASDNTRPPTVRVVGLLAVPRFNAPAAFETTFGSGGRSCVTFFGAAFARATASDMTRAVSERVAVLGADPLFKAAPAFDSMGDLGGLSLVILAAAGFDCLATNLDEELLATFCSQKWV
jgi:hypothetical protein